MAAKGLGNIVYSAPEQLKKHQKAIMETLFQASFVPTRAEIMEEGMRALTRVFKHLGTDAGSLVEDAVVNVRSFCNHPKLEDVQFCGRDEFSGGKASEENGMTDGPL
ncbi:hypothetical protein Y1Q_0020674 [Alligator mississippiensis]|uniref:Maestro/Maestro-like HEAT-repeats domain-containing protein n=1 Tax=Alligator mississippiensis TaxID=8496 RepID=A0A151MS71_ALLMI|nr:hypothetical protein Y1Q_0020674 [Alligator mississippiensis]